MERVPRSAWLTLAVVSVAVFMVAMELTIIALALPEIRSALLGATPAALSWVVNAYSIVVAALLLVSGWLADRYGRRRVFRLGLTGVRGGVGGCRCLDQHRHAHRSPGTAGHWRLHAIPGRARSVA